MISSLSRLTTLRSGRVKPTRSPWWAPADRADRAGLCELVGEHVSLPKPGGCNAAVKVRALVAGMVAGADSIDDMNQLRHGGCTASSAGSMPRRPVD